MELIWQMWGAVRLFHKNLTEDAFSDFIHQGDHTAIMESVETMAHLEEAFFHDHTSAFDKTTGTPKPRRVWRQHLWAHLFDKYGNQAEKHLAGKVKNPHGTIPSYGVESTKKSDFVNNLIEACIKNGFLDEDSEERIFLTITEKGLKFKGVDGLFVEWAKYLKPLGVAGLVGGIWALLELTPHLDNLFKSGQ
ncbi:MAG: hypothetical protein WC217_01260 [Candidatus Paceibacterota bacterium]|jgi:hypothetical protein